LAFSYWIDIPWFCTEGKLAAVLIKPSLGVSNWPVIYFINYTLTSSLALFNTAPSATSEAPEAVDSQDGDEGEDLLERTSSTMSPPPALSQDLGVDRKRKRVKEFASTSASAHKTVAVETLDIEDDEELFDALDS
jgi:hypothetical protein